MKSNVVIIGMPGCGKTTIGKLLSQRLKLKFCDADAYIEEKEGKSIKEIFEGGEEAFREIEAKRILEISKIENAVISTGGGVIKREENIEALREKGIIVFINRPLTDIMKDVDTASRPLLKEGKERLIRLYAERFELYNKYCDFEFLNNLALEDIIGIMECKLKGLIHKV